MVTPPIHRGEVLVDADGRIAAVAPVGALEVPVDIDIVDLGDVILLPGLVNAHAHPELAMFRGALEDLPFRDWILRLVGTKRSVLLDEDSHAAALWTMVESIAGGVTTLAATEASGAAAGAMTAAGVRGIVYQEVFGPDPARADESMRKLVSDLERTAAAAGAQVNVGISPHAPYSVSDALYRAAARFAVQEDLPIAVHVAESRAERELVVSGEGDFAPGLRARGIAVAPRGRSSIELLGRLGILDARPLLIHCVDVDAQDISTISEAGCAVAHCPVANAKLGHGLAPIPRLRRAGVRIGIGTDSVGSNNRLDLLEEARIASLLQRAAENCFDLLPAGELLRICTIEGAMALGLDDRIGTLEPGKQADLCAVAIDRPHTVPSLDPVDTLFHAARGSDVVLTVVAGAVLYAWGEHRTVDARSARIAIEAAAERLHGAL